MMKAVRFHIRLYRDVLVATLIIGALLAIGTGIRDSALMGALVFALIVLLEALAVLFLAAEDREEIAALESKTRRAS